MWSWFSSASRWSSVVIGIVAKASPVPRFLLIIVVLCLIASCVWAGPQVSSEPLVLHLFYSPTCTHCHAVRSLVSRVVAANPRLQAVEHNLTDPQNLELLVDFYTRYQVPEEQWGGTIAIFVGDRWWNEGDKILAELEATLGEMTGTALEMSAAGSVPRIAASERLRTLFESFAVATVAVAGLLDGINPCALATLVFLISYLSFAQRSAKEILATGLLFAAGIFVAYLGIGIGVFRALHMIEGISWASKLLYPAMVAGTLALAVYSFRDYLKARAGFFDEMTLKLPRPLSQLSHRVIRRTVNLPSILGIAFVAGVVLSLLELFCTGQIYLPTLMYIVGAEGLRTKALPLLVLYVALFTVPVVALTLAAYAGVTSSRLTNWARNNVATVKLATFGLFLLLTIYLVGISFRFFIA